MAENDTILGTLGNISFLATAGYAGNLAYKRIKEMRKFEASRSVLSNRPVQVTKIVANNLKETGFDALNYSGRMSDVFIGDQIKDIRSRIDTVGKGERNTLRRFFTQQESDLLFDITQLINTKTNHNFHVQVQRTKGGVVSGVDLVGDKGLKISLGNHAVGGTITHAGSARSRKVYVPRFLDSQSVNNVLGGIDSIGQPMSYNVAKYTALKDSLLHNIGSASKGSEKIFTDYEMRNIFDEITEWFGATERVVANNKFVRDVTTNSVVPLLYENNKLIKRKNSVFNKTVNAFTSNLQNLFFGKGYKQSGFGLSPEQVAEGTFIPPNSSTLLQREYNNIVGNSSFEGSKEFNQGFTRDARFKNRMRHKFNDPSLNKMAAQGNAAKLDSLFINMKAGNNQELWGSLLTKGAGWDGIPMADALDDGYFITKRLANEVLETPYSFRMMSKSDLIGNVKPDMENLLNELVSFSANKTYGNTTLTANKSIQYRLSRLNKIRERFPDKAAVIQAERNRLLETIWDKDLMPQILRDYSREKFGSDRFTFNKFFGDRNVDFFEDQVKQYGFHRDMDFKLSNIIIEKGGLTARGFNKNTYLQTAGKKWGSSKNELSGVFNNKDAAFMFMLAKENDDVANIILDPNMTGHKFQSYIQKQKRLHKKLYKNVPEAVTHQKYRQSGAGDMSGWGKLTERETLASGGKALQNIYDDWGIVSEITSHGDAVSMYGMEPGQLHAVNSIGPKRLRAQGLNTAADVLEAQFDTANFNALADTYTPMFGDARANHYAIDINNPMLQDESVMNKLFGGNLQEAIEQARQLTVESLSKDNVSKQTRFFIRANDKNIPLPLVESNYSFAMNSKNFQEADGLLLKNLSSKTRMLVSSMLRGNLQDLNAGWGDVRNEAARILGDPNSFTHVYGLGKDGRSLISQGFVRDESILNSTFLNSFEQDLTSRYAAQQGISMDEAAVGAKRNIENVLSKYGLDYKNIDEERFHGLQNDRFAYETGVMDLKGDFASRSKQAWQMITREPAYTHEGMSMSRALPMNSIYGDLIGLAPGMAKSDTINEFMKYNLDSHAVFLNAKTRQEFGDDLDFDPKKLISFPDEESRLKAIKEFENRNQYMSTIYSDKGIMKPTGKTLRRSYLEAAQVEKAGISEAYKNALRYQVPFNDYTGVLTGDAGIISNKKAVLNSFFTNLPESFIGGKLFATQEDRLLAQSIFDQSLDIDTRSKNFRSIANKAEIQYRKTSSKYGVTQDMIGKNVFDHLFSDDELKGVLNSGSDIPEPIIKYLRGDHFKAQDWINLNTAMGDHPYGSKLVSPEINAFERSRPQYGKTGRFMEGFADIAEDVIPRVLKNRTVQGLAAASLIAGLVLQSPDSALKHQQVREESQPQGIPNGAQAIDPPTAVVARPRAKGLRMTVKGRIPNGISGSDLNRGLNDMGLSTSSTYIDKNPHVEGDYVKKLQDEERYNKWNMG